jgi:hypothetical protein
MKQLQFYKYAAWVLLVLNISMLAFFFLTKPGPPHTQRPFKNRAVDVMHLDKQQHDIFLQYVKLHRQQMDSINDQQAKLLQPYFYSLIDSTKVADTAAVLDAVQALERKKIVATYQHFKQVKSNLRSDQQPNFETFMNQALEMILLQTKKNPHPPKDFPPKNSN